MSVVLSTGTLDRIRELVAGQLSDSEDTMRSFVDWAEGAVESVTASDDEYEVYVDLGQFGESNTTVSVALEEELDVATFIDDESPIYVRDLDAVKDTIEEVREVLGELIDEAETADEAPPAPAVIPAAMDEAERTVADQVAALVRSLTLVPGEGSALRIAGQVLTNLGYLSGPDLSVLSLPLESGTGSNVRYMDLRPGDYITSVGRVLTVEPDGTHTYARVTGDATVTDEAPPLLAPLELVTEPGRTGRGSWNVRRAIQMTTTVETAGPDPLTFPLGDDEFGVKTQDLRLGDDVTGDGFGRVVAVDREAQTATLNRNGTVREIGPGSWSVLRAIQPGDEARVPLTVRSDELTIGDRILGREDRGERLDDLYPWEVLTAPRDSGDGFVRWDYRDSEGYEQRSGGWSTYRLWRIERVAS